MSDWKCLLLGLYLSVLMLLAMPAPGRQEDELVRGNGGEPETLDPHLMQGAPEGWIAYDLFEGLVTYDNKGQLIPGQAQSWKVEDNGRKWVFHLRKDLKWSDGTPLTANDFEYSYRRLADPKTAAAYSWFMEGMEISNATAVIRGRKPVEQLGVKATSPERLEFYLDSPVSYFSELLAFYGFLPVPRHVVEAKGSKWTLPENIVSNGAFKLQQWRVNEKIRAVRNPLYRDHSSTRLDTVVYITGGDELSRFRSGEIDITNNVKLEHENWVLKNRPEWLRTERWMSTGVMFLNLRNQHLQRKANRMALALDRDAIARSRAAGTAEAAWQVVPPHFDGFRPDMAKELTETLDKRTERARELLHGMSEIGITYCLNCGNESRIAIATAQEWQKRLRIKVHLQGYERKHFHSVLAEGRYDIAVIQWIGPYQDPASLLNILQSDSANNRSFYKNQGYDELLLKARSMVGNDPERMTLYGKAEELLMKDAPVIPVVHHRNVRLVSERVEGYLGLNPMGRLYSRYLSLN
ncbi:MAG: peptide ABC transporter substrate-binding protein [Endozoicomonas sp.]